jgi:hypothetical protein
VRNQVNKEYRNHSSAVLADTMKKAWGVNQVYCVLARMCM